ncbi:hypothetical protein [Microbacterium invictum]|uniref:Uncharacterized protein n=1 Tax=Microbacterium invictum TaxID=515415 RepID=A0ABZ0VCH4_9MICO|nr:hypothetical protein [Microbacterium invictum]WQB70250.1 hypothetical protein T9R20_16360 [Microbacterium invictum]
MADHVGADQGEGSQMTEVVTRSQTGQRRAHTLTEGVRSTNGRPHAVERRIKVTRTEARDRHT